MTDNEIMKAMECCGSRGVESCVNCPLAKKYTFGECAEIMFNEIKNLIRRQKSEIEKIKTKLKYYLETNEENGVVYIPKFIIDNLVKEMTEGKEC